MMFEIIAVATTFTLILWWFLDLIRTDEKAVRIRFGLLGRKGRRLGRYEEFLWTAQNKAGFGVNVNVLLLENYQDISEGHVRQALDALWRRHPILRCSVITISKGKVSMNYFTEISGKPSYELHMVPSGEWREVFEEELNNRFVSSAPQWRVKVTLPGWENGRYVFPFIFSFNSCIADDVSITEAVFKDFQQFLLKAVHPDPPIPQPEPESDVDVADSSALVTSNIHMSSSMMSFSGSSIMSYSQVNTMSIPGDSISDPTTDADDPATSTRDVTRTKSRDAKGLRLFPATEFLYEELKSRWYENLVFPIAHRFYHKPFLSPDSLSVEIQKNLRPVTPVRKTGVRTFLLNEKETEIFSTECCKKRISVTSAVLAAGAVSLQDILSSKAFYHGKTSLKLNALVFCDMRQASARTVPSNTLANHEGLLDINICLPKCHSMTQDVWKRAQSLHQTLEKKSQSDNIFSWSRWFNHLLSPGNGVNSFLAAARKNPSEKSYALSVRERGELRTDVTEGDERCSLVASYFTSAEHMVGLALFSIGVATIQGQLCVTIGYDRHVVDKVIAEEFAYLLKEHLTKKAEVEIESSKSSPRFWRLNFKALPFWYSSRR